MMLELIPENHLILLRNGTEYFPHLIDDINKAEQEIFLESYIFIEDTIGQQVASALRMAAQRGVRVQLLLDGFGSRALAPEFIKSLKRAGVRVLFFRPDVAKFSLKRQRLRRMHRKVAVFDNKVAYVGGINILEDSEVATLPPRYDYAVRIEGGLVLRIHAAADQLWRHTCRVQLKLDWAKRSKVKPALPPLPGEITAGLAIRDNFRNRHVIENAYLRAIAAAKKEIVIANAYFLPAKRFCDALIIAARRGVKVHILVQGRIDYFIQYFATRTLYERFLKADVYIYEYTLGFMHAKVAVIDKNWSTVGSSNIDPFSLLLAREANVFIQHPLFSQELRDDIMQAIEKNAIQIQLADLKAQPWLLRILSQLCYQLVRGILGLVGYGKQEYE
jgi:cardiolipin synthase